MARKKKVEEDKGDSFTVLFLALSIILLAFFILLNSIAVIDEAQSRKALASLIGTFGVSGGGMMYKFGLTRLNEEETQEVVEKWMTKWEEAAKGQTQMEIERLLMQVSEKEGMDSVLTSRLGQDLAITFPSKILFNKGSTEISEDAKKVLNVIAERASELKTRLSIEGHTDPYTEDADPGINPWELSAYRAAAVGRYMLSTGYTKPDDLTLKGLAGAQPMHGGETPENRENNRRVVIVMLKALELSKPRGAFWKRYGLRDPFKQSEPPDEDVDF